MAKGTPEHIENQIRVMPGRIMEIISQFKSHSTSREDQLHKLYAVLNYAARVRDMEEEMRKTYTIQLKINFNDDSRHDHALQMMREKAQEVLAMATLISDGRKPQVALQSEDYFEGIEDKALLTDEDKSNAGM